MNTVRFECEVVTPMFMAGADQEYAELRAPSIKGLIRWWFRAMMGGVLGDNVPDLHKLESKVFGNIDSRSPISVRITNVNPNPPRVSSQPRLPHKTENAQKAWRNAIGPSQAFRVDLSLTNRASADSKLLLDVAGYSLLLALTLGGFGNRSRRGFGSVFLGGDSLKGEKEIVCNAEKIFKKYALEQGVNCASWVSTPTFPCIARNYFDVWIAERKGKWVDELSLLMNTMHEFKRSANRKAIGGERPSRQASPLIVHAKPVDGGLVRLVFSYFRCELSSAFSIDDGDRDALVKTIETKLNAKKLSVLS